MTRALILALGCALTLSACARISESRLNPFNWFGDSEETTSVAVEVETDPRPLVAQVTTLVVEQTPTGAIIRATGLPPTQGWFEAELVPQTDKPFDGVWSFEFRIVPPIEPQRISTVRSREVTVGYAISPFELAATREVRVIGAQNIRTARR